MVLGTYYVVQVGFEFTEIHLPLAPKCLHSRHVPCLADNIFLKIQFYWVIVLLRPQWISHKSTFHEFMIDFYSNSFNELCPLQISSLWFPETPNLFWPLWYQQAWLHRNSVNVRPLRLVRFWWKKTTWGQSMSSSQRNEFWDSRGNRKWHLKSPSLWVAAVFCTIVGVWCYKHCNAWLSWHCPVLLLPSLVWRPVLIFSAWSSVCLLISPIC